MEIPSGSPLSWLCLSIWLLLLCITSQGRRMQETSHLNRLVYSHVGGYTGGAGTDWDEGCKYLRGMN